MYNYYYVASPYSHNDSKVRAKRHHLVTKFCAELHKHHIPFFAPITQSVEIAKYLNEKTSWDDWKDQDIALLHRSVGIIVYTIPGWKDSVGVTAEIQHAKAHMIPIFYLSKNDLKNESIIDILQERI